MLRDIRSESYLSHVKEIDMVSVTAVGSRRWWDELSRLRVVMTEQG